MGRKDNMLKNLGNSVSLKDSGMTTKNGINRQIDSRLELWKSGSVYPFGRSQEFLAVKIPDGISFRNFFERVSRSQKEKTYRQEDSNSS
jgi:hypothetical protein